MGQSSDSTRLKFGGGGGSVGPMEKFENVGKKSGKQKKKVCRATKTQDHCFVLSSVQKKVFSCQNLKSLQPPFN